jgi:hypothetical protein
MNLLKQKRAPFRSFSMIPIIIIIINHHQSSSSSSYTQRIDSS